MSPIECFHWNRFESMIALDDAAAREADEARLQVGEHLHQVGRSPLRRFL